MIINRKVITAQADLKEIGWQARQKAFESSWNKAADKKARLKEEEKRLIVVDKKRAEERKGMGIEERWRVELKDAFNALAICKPPVNGGGEDEEGEEEEEGSRMNKELGK